MGRGYLNRPGLESVFIAPHTEVERIIAGIWQEVIGIKKVGVKDIFLISEDIRCFWFRFKVN